MCQYCFQASFPHFINSIKFGYLEGYTYRRRYFVHVFLKQDHISKASLCIISVSKWSFSSSPCWFSLPVLKVMTVFATSTLPIRDERVPQSELWHQKTRCNSENYPAPSTAGNTCPSASSSAPTGQRRRPTGSTSTSATPRTSPPASSTSSGSSATRSR